MINRLNMTKIKPDGVKFSTPDNTSLVDMSRITIQPADDKSEYTGSKNIRYRRRDIAKFFVGSMQTHTATSRTKTTVNDVILGVLAKYRMDITGMVIANPSTVLDFAFGDTVQTTVTLDDTNSMTWKGTLSVKVTLAETTYPTDVNAFWNGVMETSTSATLQLPYPNKGSLTNLAYYINGVKVTPTINTTTKTVTTTATYPAGRYTVSIRATSGGPYDMLCTQTKLVEILSPWRIPITTSVLGLIGGTNTVSKLAGCTLLRKIPTDMFQYCGAITNLDSWFEGCTMLQGLPKGLMDPLVSLKSATKMFKNCKHITMIHPRFVARSVLLLNVTEMFLGCDALLKENVPANPWEGTLVPGTVTNVFNWL